MIHNYFIFLRSHALNNEQIEALALNPSLGVNLPCVRVTIGRLRAEVIAIVPMLTNCSLSGAKGHYPGCFELDFVSWHFKTPPYHSMLTNICELGRKLKLQKPFLCFGLPQFWLLFASVLLSVNCQNSLSKSQRVVSFHSLYLCPC